MDDWKKHKDVITALLNSTDGQVHMSFDLWTAGNLISLNRVIVHFIDEDAWKCTFLLDLPQVEGSHTGENIANGVGEIISKFDLQDRIGYFVLDNVSNNDSCIEALAEEFGFNAKHRRLRCAGHIINLVAKALLFGNNVEAFEADIDASKELINEFKLWKKHGPIGKVHNTVLYIGWSDQRSQ